MAPGNNPSGRRRLTLKVKLAGGGTMKTVIVSRLARVKPTAKPTAASPPVPKKQPKQPRRKEHPMPQRRTFTISGHTIDPTAFPLLGEGGTAWVYDLSSKIPKTAIKVMKSLTDIPAGFERQQAEDRLKELKERLKAFPKLPPGVAGPDGVFYDGDYVSAVVMRKVEGVSLTALADYEWRVKHHFGTDKVRRVFTSLAHTWRALHADGIVVADVKPENVIVEKGEPVLIDTEGIQFGKFRGRGYTPSCVDPMICKRTTSGEIRTNAAFSPATDWFGFAVMCFQCLTFVHPYDGMYWKSKANGKHLDEFGRKEHGVSVYHPAVTAPRFAKLADVGDELTEYFREMFAHKSRRPFPVHMLEEGWSRISPCTFQAVPGGIPSSAHL